MNKNRVLISPQGMPFESKPPSYSSVKPSSPEAAAFSSAADENQEVEQPGTPVPSEDPEVSDNGASSRNPLTIRSMTTIVELHGHYYTVCN